MTFTGYGIVWDLRKARPLVNFKHDKTYSTDDPKEIEILSKAAWVTVVDESVDQAEPKLSRKGLLKKAKAAGVKGADRMSKAELMEIVG